MSNLHFLGSKVEDRFGKTLIISVFGAFLIVNFQNIYNIFLSYDGSYQFFLNLTGRVANLIFIGLLFYFTVVRSAPRESAAGISPRLVAIIGTYMVTFLGALPPTSDVGPLQQGISACFSIVGTLLSAWCLCYLGRSFSIMATSRELKTTGAYAFVRHPLYAAETVMTFGLVLGNGTLFAFGLGVAWFFVQLRRAQYEETILRKSFPEYEDYARRVPMIIPFT